MSREQRTLLNRCLRLALRPAVRFCLRHAFRLQDAIDALKLEFVEAARESLSAGGQRPNTSRIAVMTGVHRRDVSRIEADGMSASTSQDLITKIVGQWRQDSRFTTKGGEPRVLSIGTNDAEFVDLVRSVSSDVAPAAVLFELERVKAIEHARSGVRLVIQSYVPKGDVEGGFTIYSRDCDDLCRSVEENTIDEQEIVQLHIRTEYDNVRPGAWREIRRWLLKEGHAFHARAREFLSQFDQDINPDPGFKGPGKRVVVTSFGNVSEDKTS